MASSQEIVPAAAQVGGVRIAIDRGGTFCDVWAFIPQALWHEPSPSLLGNAIIIPGDSTGKFPGTQIQLKLLSVDPQNYADAPSEGIRRVMQIVRGVEIPKNVKINTDGIESVRMGTTVATNALLERKGVRFGVVLTEGFKDLLEMGDQTRPDLFDLKIATKPSLLYRHSDVIEAAERVTIESWSFSPENKTAAEILEDGAKSADPGRVEIGLSGEVVRIWKPLDEVKMRSDLEKLYGEGVRSLAVCLLHSSTYPGHEQRIAEIAREIGFTQVSLSSLLSPAPRAVPRGNSATLDAYISPVLDEYIASFLQNFEGGNAGARCEFMKSDGGLVAANKFTGLRALLSGPAGGVVGCALTAYSKKKLKPIVGFDMGGTSTDVCRYAGKLDMSYESLTAGIKVACAQLAIETVAAGGGSRLFYKNGLFVVGPESVGAHPGPACYRKGGELAITDANLVLGRLIPSQFPSIFGQNADLPLDVEASLSKFRELTERINLERAGQVPYSIDEVAAGFVRVANEGMSRPMRLLTQQRGFAPSAHDLCCFGGAGGQHACAIAQGLGIETVIVPRFSSILSAFGIACADITSESTDPAIGAVADAHTFSTLDQKVASLKVEVKRKLAEQDVAEEDTTLEVTLGCFYDGSDTVFQIPYTRSVEADFIARHLRETSFSMKRKVRYSGVTVVGTGKSSGFTPEPVDFQEELDLVADTPSEPSPSSVTSAYFATAEGGKRMDTAVYVLSRVAHGSLLQGPAILVDNTQTIVVEPGASAHVLSQHVIINVPTVATATVGGDEELKVDPIMLAVFSNRFMSIAEQMGILFQKTSISLSIKERLDFSCSIHSTNGALVANAPHIPIHLGSMQYAVQSQHERWLGQLKPGDVLLTNHPETGGTHLPDMTVVTPIFDPKDLTKILFYVASRGHHTDIGGNSVTSMNPIAKELWEEGVAVRSMKIVSEGQFFDQGVRDLFNDAAKYPGCSATRMIEHNITDLQAAISANVRGSLLVNALFEEFGSPMVLFYMSQIQTLASRTIESFFRSTYERFGGRPLEAMDYMDDGTIIQLKITINPETGKAVFDWTGTGPQIHGNCNIPISISYAAIIYCLRCMINPEIPMPLNQGVLDPVTNIVPRGCIMNPTAEVAVSGSTIASQRLVDVILRAFNACAASQGDGNSLGFGTGGKDAFGNVMPGFAYGEAIGGGAGAGEGWHGQSSVSVHSTNTRLTDVEVIESRTPLMMRTYAIRAGSGGKGKWRGGNGCVRHFIARENVNCSIVSQRRVFAPYGLEGGANGARGQNIWYRKREDGDGFDAISMGHNGMIKMRKGDEVCISTPGGGGWGTPMDEEGA